MQQEITERRRVVDSLQQRERLLQTMLDHTDVVVYVKQLDGRYMLVNKCFEQLAGQASEQIVGSTDEDIFTPEAAARFRSNDLDVIKRNDRIQFEEVLHLHDGERTFVSVKFPLRDANGQPSGVCGI